MDVLIMGTLYILFWVVLFICFLILGINAEREKSEDFKDNSNIFIGAILFVLIFTGILSLIF
jgi:hypothetical protein